MTPRIGKMQSSPDSLESFVVRVGDLLARPVSSRPPLATGSLFPRDDPPDLLIHVGVLSAEQARNLRDQLPARSFLLALYPDSESARAFVPAVGERTLTARIAEGAHYTEKVALLTALLPERRVRLVVGEGWRERLTEPLRRIEESILAALDNAQQERNRGLIRLRASLRNLPSIVANQGLQLKRVPPGTAAVVCGAGPSLSRHLEALRAARSRAILIAVGHAVPTLQRAGIRPDVVVEVDAHAQCNWPEGLTCEALLVACTELAPGVASRFSRVWWCAGSSPAFNLAAQQWRVLLREIQLAKTVTVPAIDFAVRLGCSTIALTGQDFCLAEDGTSHAGGERREGIDRPVDLPGNDAPTVTSTRNFASLRDALQQYLRFLNGGLPGLDIQPRVINATPGGARIEGAMRQSLEEALSGCPEPDRSADRWAQGTASPPPLNELRATEKGIREYAALTDVLLDMGAKLRADLTRSPLDMESIRRRQRMLQQVVGNEDAKRREEGPSVWLNPLILHVDTVLKETPGAISSSTDPLAQLDFLARRFEFIRDLCADLLNDFAWVKAEFESATSETITGMKAEAGDPLVFGGFREQALRQIRRENPVFASWMRRQSPAPEHLLEIRWLNQYVPYVACHGANGTEIPLSGFVDMIEQGGRDVEAFVSRHRFDPSLHAVVFAGPGNWAHVLEFAKRYPAVRIMVLDPWPGLLAAMIERGCFLHHLPADTLVTAATDAFPEWIKQVADRVVEWKKAGLFPLVFAHPRAESIEEVRAIVTRLEEEVWSLL